MDPVPRKRMAGGLGLRAFVLVVREHEVVAGTVQIEALAEQIERHRRALDVPARPAGTPRRVPRGLARLRGLPEHEVDGRALPLVDIDARAGGVEQLFDRSMRQCAVRRERGHVEVHAAAIDDVRMVRVDELGDELEHARDVLRGVGDVVRFADVEAIHGRPPRVF